jgi:hypothetical protein
MDMCRKAICLNSFVLVLALLPMSITRGADPGLVGWWKLDDGSGTVAKDSSGNGNDGTIVGNPQWVQGKINGALEFDGTGDNINAASVQLSPNAFTLTLWFNSNSALGASSTREDLLYWQVGNGRPHITFNRSGTGEIGLWPNIGGDFNGPVTTTRSWAAGTWYHITGTFDGTSFKIYVNGTLENVVDHPGTHSAASGLLIGCRTNQRNYFRGKIDDVRLYNRALTQEEIQRVMIGIPPGAASDPKPANEATNVPRDVVLGWKPGEFAPAINGHKVYLSENFNDVNDGIGGITQDANSYTPSQRLDFGKTYYWRVDEVNGPPDYTVYKGDVWSFTTEPIGYPIENITATASSTHNADMGPEKTVNGSGLDADDLHSKEPADMWLSSSEPLGAWIEFQFDKVYKLHQMWVWNSNQMVESLVGFGFKGVTIAFSTNGTDYTTLDGVPEFAQAPGADGYAHNTTVALGGVAAKYVRLTANSNWGALFQFGLSEVRFFYIPVYAREPNPGSGATDVDLDVTLSFRAGREAATHDVYLSADEQAVIDGTAPVATVTEANYGPLSLDLSMTYYWKINEVNMAETPTTWEGDLWSFTTRQFLVVDDFESYNDLDTTDPQSDRIFNTWIDGYGVPTNGSIVGYENPPFCEQAVVHGGKQSMPLAYSNTGGATYSEAERTFAVGQNWTKAGIATLVLFFYGTAGNTGQLYMKVNGSKVVYGGDAGDIAKVQWQRWNIDLLSLGVNLQNITKLSIGIDGNGASGKLYLDDIRLYRLAT